MNAASQGVMLPRVIGTSLLAFPSPNSPPHTHPHERPRTHPNPGLDSVLVGPSACESNWIRRSIALMAGGTQLTPRGGKGVYFFLFLFERTQFKTRFRHACS